MKLNKTDLFEYVVVAIVVLLIAVWVWLKFQYVITSNYFKFNKNYVNDDIVVVTIDEATLNSSTFPRYQDINRYHYSQVIQNILKDEPKIVGVDVTFFWESNDIKHDKTLTKILSRNDNVLLVTEIASDWQCNAKFWPLPLFFKWENAKNYWYVNVIHKNKLNVLNYEVDVEGECKKRVNVFNTKDYKNVFHLYFTWENQILPNAVAIYKKLNNFKKSFVSDKKITFDDKEKIPLDDWVLNVNYFSDKFKTYSLIQVFEGNARGVFKDKIVLIWATASDIHDEFYTPYKTSDFIPWVMIHANLLNTLLAKKYITYQGIYSFLLTNLVLIVLFILSVVWGRTIYHGLAYSVVSLCSFILLSVVLFLVYGLMIEVFPAVISFVLVNLMLFGMKYLEEKKSKDSIRRIFSKYVSKNVVDDMISKWTDDLWLWWREKAVTVFFSDLVWFTNLSEDLDPEQLWKILNIYFETMSSIIIEKWWTIDKFMGDAIMAFWNAPLDTKDHEDLSCEVALLQRKALDIVRWEVEKLWSTAAIDMRIGVNTWLVIVWNFWCALRYDYTILWDTVNLGSRLEWINKQYGTKIMFSEYTYEHLSKDRFLIRELDLITVKWKVHPVRIYELLWFDDWKQDEIKQNIQKYEEALALYRRKDFQKAIELFTKVWDNPSKIFITRCEECLKTGVSNDWDGVYRFQTK